MSAETDYPSGDERSEDRSLLGPIMLTLAVLVAIGAIVLVVLGIPEWTEDDQDDEINPDVTLNEIDANPEAYAGTVVTVSGEVANVVSPRAVVIGGEEFYGGADLLVVNDEEIRLPQGGDTDEPEVEENDLIQVTGTVRVLAPENQDQFPDEFRVLFEDEAFDAFEGQPVVVAQALDLSPRRTPIDDQASALVSGGFQPSMT